MNDSGWVSVIVIEAVEVSLGSIHSVDVAEGELLLTVEYR